MTSVVALFDASLVSCEGKRHEVIDSYGHNQLGGDDFDSALADLVFGQTGPRARAAKLA